jgi:NAD-dependent deacetylase
VFSELDPHNPFEWLEDLDADAWKAEKGALRPNVVWFGEDVPLMKLATDWVQCADFFLVVGTSLQVYPAAHLIYELKPGTPAWYVDPNPEMQRIPGSITCIRATASEGIQQIKF